METKICFKCGRELPLSEFYKHPKMTDGHLNKCKECNKKDVHENYLKNIQNEDYVEKERKRGRDKYRRLNYVSRPSAHNENKTTRANAKKNGINCDGKEIHHWNYNLKNDIFLLGRREHKKVHLNMKFNKEMNVFEYNGNLLLTKEDHLQAIKEILGVNEVENYNLEFM